MEETNKGIQILRMAKQIMVTVKQNMGQHFKQAGFTEPQGILMGTLARYGEMKVSDLSERMGLSNSTVSGILDRLEVQGLIERTRSKEDRRVVYVNVTSKFRDNAKAHFEEFEKKFDAMVSKAAPEELDIVIQGLNKLKEIIER